MTSFAISRFGIEKAVVEPLRLRRLGYRLLGELHIPGRIRLHHVFSTLNTLNLPQSGVRMLDAGTGRGDIALHCSRLRPGWQVTGVDIEQEQVDHCRLAAERLGIERVRFQRLDLLELDARAEYDLITCTDVLEHIEDDKRAISNLARALRPGGYLVLTFPSVPQRRHLRLVGWRERRIGFHPSNIGHVRQGYGPAQISALLRAANLDVQSVRWTYGPFGTLAHDIFFVIGDSQPNPIVFAAVLPILLSLTFLEFHTPIHHGSGLTVVATGR